MKSDDSAFEPLEVKPAVPAAPQRSVLARARRALREEVQALSWRLIVANLLVSLLPTLGFSRLRTAIYRAAGISIGPHSLIFGRIEFSGGPINPANLRIGAHTIINANLFVDLSDKIDIGNWVSIGHHVIFVTASHEMGPAYQRAGPLRPMPITIEDGSWLGARSTLLPGVVVGKSSVVAAGSLVSAAVPENKLVGGNPCRPLKSLPQTP
jgi:maltose O-acetyltransferase